MGHNRLYARAYTINCSAITVDRSTCLFSHIFRHVDITLLSLKFCSCSWQCCAFPAYYNLCLCLLQRGLCYLSLAPLQPEGPHKVQFSPAYTPSCSSKYSMDLVTTTWSYQRDWANQETKSNGLKIPNWNRYHCSVSVAYSLTSQPPISIGLDDFWLHK